MSELRHRVKTRIKNIIYAHIAGMGVDEDAEQILSIPELACIMALLEKAGNGLEITLVDREAELPTCLYQEFRTTTGGLDLYVQAYQIAQQDMLKNRWVREVSNG